MNKYIAGMFMWGVIIRYISKFSKILAKLSEIIQKLAKF